jgi:hypothetical protein
MKTNSEQMNASTRQSVSKPKLQLLNTFFSKDGTIVSENQSNNTNITVQNQDQAREDECNSKGSNEKLKSPSNSVDAS